MAFVTLPDGWLATELAAVDAEIAAWPEGLRESFESLQAQVASRPEEIHSGIVQPGGRRKALEADHNPDPHGGLAGVLRAAGATITKPSRGA